MAQILLSSTCKASVGERERETIRGSGLQEFLQKNNTYSSVGTTSTKQLY